MASSQPPAIGSETSSPLLVGHHSLKGMPLQTKPCTNTDDGAHTFTDGDYTTAFDGDDSPLEPSADEVDVMYDAENQPQKD